MVNLRLTTQLVQNLFLLLLFTFTLAIVGCWDAREDSTIAAPNPAVPEQTRPSAMPPVYGYQVVQAYPHDPQAFTQGLIYHGGELYEGTGLYGESSLRRVNLATGDVVQIHELEPQYFGEGITLWQGRLLQLTWRSQVGFVYDRQTFEPLQQFTYPTEGWGLTQDGERLILSDGSDRLYFLDPETFEVLGSIPVQDQGQPVPFLNELEYVQGEVFANVWFSNRIARIDPATGTVTGWIDLTNLVDQQQFNNPDAVLNGIAYDSEGDRLFVTGKLWPQLFEIKLVAP
jgi:glutamine cyclotransferase